MSGFESSTHRRFWLFTEAELAAHRAGAHERAIEAARVAWHAYEESAGLPMTEREFLNMEQLRVLLVFTKKKYFALTKKALDPPLKVLATGLGFFDRFYAVRSAIEYNPERVMETLLFLAFKVEEVPMTLSGFAKGLRAANPTLVPDVSILRRLEPELLEALRFHLHIEHPLHALVGFVTMMLELSPATDFGPLYAKATALFESLLQDTELALRFPPSQLALALLKRASDQTELNVDAFIQRQFGQTVEGHAALVAVLDKILGDMDAFDAFRKANVKNAIVNAHGEALKSCRNPETDDSHPYFAMLREKKQRESDARALARRDALRSKAAEAKPMDTSP